MMLTSLPYSFVPGYGQDRFRDLVNALATFQRKPHIGWDELSRISYNAQTGIEIKFNGQTFEKKVAGETITVVEPDRGISVWLYQNGNAHVIFSKETLLDINRALAEFYGDVLPDVEEDGLPHQTSTAVSKDLQFYWSPQEVVDAALDFANVRKREDYSGSYRDNFEPSSILEPSCGDGRILDEIRARGHRGFGIEYHAGRAAEAKAKGHAVLTSNFLDHPATAKFDYVIMNPPFYGKHYAKHVRHAHKFLKPGGTLVAILPATARYDHDELADMIPVSRYNDVWKDLPVASFAEVGTNVPTTMLRISKPREE
jgi:SAM-dependent methyltransferase